MAVIDSKMADEKNPGIEAQRAKMSFLFREDVAPGLRLEMDLNKILFTSESEFQQIDVVETYFGKVLCGKTLLTLSFFVFLAYQLISHHYLLSDV